MKNKKIYIKIISLLLILFYSLNIFAIDAQKSGNDNTTHFEWPYYKDKISSKAAFVMDADSSVILYEKNANERLFPASLTKIMTAIVVLDKIKENYNDLVTFSYNAVTKDIDKQSVTIGASAGDQLSVKDCLYSLLLPSANDAANALAEHIAGSISDFALLMNEKAKNIGLTNTNFVNPSGLHDDNQYTTASDIAKILQYALQYPLFIQISSSLSYRHAPIRKYKNPENSNNLVLNTNSIIIPGSDYYYKGVTTGKTGHTELAGYNLASSAKKNNMHLICVVLGANNDNQRFGDTKNLYDFYFNNYQSLSIKETDPRFTKKINTFSINDVELIETLNITCNDNAHITLPKSATFDNVQSIITYKVKDIYNKYAIGYITYMLGSKEIGSCNLEGRNTIDLESIFIGHLDLGNVVNNNSFEIIDKKNNSYQHNLQNALIYKNSNGNIVITKSLLTFFIIFSIFSFIILTSLFIYTKIFTNSNFSMNKFLFKLRRFFKKFF